MRPLRRSSHSASVDFTAGLSAHGEDLSMRTLISSCGSSVTSAAASASDTTLHQRARNTSSAAMMASPVEWRSRQRIWPDFHRRSAIFLAQDLEHVAVPTLARANAMPRLMECALRPYWSSRPDHTAAQLPFAARCEAMM